MLSWWFRLYHIYVHQKSKLFFRWINAHRQKLIKLVKTHKCLFSYVNECMKKWDKLMFVEKKNAVFRKYLHGIRPKFSFCCWNFASHLQVKLTNIFLISIRYSFSKTKTWISCTLPTQNGIKLHKRSKEHFITVEV